MPSLSDDDLRVRISTEADTSGVDRTKSSINNLEDSENKATTSGINWSDSMMKAGAVAAGIVASISLVAKTAIDSAAQYEQSRVSFETMLGSADKARVLLKQVSDFAASTPFELPQVVDGAKHLMAFGVAQQDVISTFTTLGNVAAGVGVDKLPNLINVYGQVKSAGRLMSQDLLQFTSTGVPIIDLLAQHFGTTTGKVRDLVQAGKVGFDDLKGSLELLGGPTGKWGDLMDKQSKTFDGTMSNISDNMGRILRQAVGIGPEGDIRKGSLFDTLTKAATNFMNWLGQIQPVMDNITKFFETTNGAAGGLAGALAGLAAGPIIAIVVAIGWIPLAIVAASAVIGAVVGYIVSQWGNFVKAIQPAIDAFNKYLLPVLQATWKFVSTVFMDAWRNLVSAFNNVVAAVKPWLPQLEFLGKLIVGVVVVAIVAFIVRLALVVSAIAWVISAVVNIISWIVHMASIFWKAVWDIGAAMVSFVNAILGGKTSAENAFRDLINKIIGIVKGAFGGMFDAGKNLVQGFINGIGSMVHSAVNAAKGLGDKAASAVKNALGIHSPSLVFHEIGVNMGQGMVNGLDSMRSIAATTATNLAGLTASSTTNGSRNTVANLAPTSITNASSSAITNHITVNATTPEAVREVFAMMNGDMRLVGKGMAMNGGGY